MKLASYDGRPRLSACNYGEGSVTLCLYPNSLSFEGIKEKNKDNIIYIARCYILFLKF